MPKDMIYNFIVAGRGDFPMDMLRYDECYPDSTNDAMRIPYPTNEYSERVRLHDTRRQIKLLSHKIPTAARWASFGWTVVEFMHVPVVDGLNELGV